MVFPIWPYAYIGGAIAAQNGAVLKTKPGGNRIEQVSLPISRLKRSASGDTQPVTLLVSDLLHPAASHAPFDLLPNLDPLVTVEACDEAPSSGIQK